MNYYWATEGLGNNTKVFEGHISSPKLTRDGKKLNFYDTLQKVKSGDIIFSFTNKHIISIGIAQSEAKSVKIPDYRDYRIKPTKIVEGWKINVNFKVISEKHQFSPSEHFIELKKDLPEKYSPLDKNGNGCNNAYFTQISEDLKNNLIRLIGSEYVAIINELNGESSKEVVKKQNINNWSSNVNLIKTSAPEIKKSKPTNKISRKIPKTTLPNSDKQKDQDVGDAGEALVFKFEQKFVKEEIDENLLEWVKHKSKEEIYSPYDIQSLTKQREEKFIEVKTTTGGKNTPFDISVNEVKFSKENARKYSIYRIYNFSFKSNKLEFFEIEGDISKKRKLEVTEYRCYPTEECNETEN